MEFKPGHFYKSSCDSVVLCQDGAPASANHFYGVEINVNAMTSAERYNDSWERDHDWKEVVVKFTIEKHKHDSKKFKPGCFYDLGDGDLVYCQKGKSTSDTSFYGAMVVGTHIGKAFLNDGWEKSYGHRVWVSTSVTDKKEES